ncbi:MAG: YezD family protein [Gammaproteobacteria bacterium]
MTSPDLNITDPAKAALVRRVLEAIEGMRYGSVEIVVHDARVVQLERRERFRFDANR